MALLSLVFLLLAIMLGFIRKMNTGLLCIAFALLLGRMAGISDAEIIKGFNASLFLMLLGVLHGRQERSRQRVRKPRSRRRRAGTGRAGRKGRRGRCRAP